MRRITFLVTVTLVMLCALPYLSIAAPTLKQIDSYLKKMEYHQKDLMDIRKNIDGKDWEIATYISNISFQYLLRVSHIRNLLMIESLIQNPADRGRVSSFNKVHIKSIPEQIDLSIEEVNLHVSYLKNQGVIAMAIKLRDDLRGLKHSLQSSE